MSGIVLTYYKTLLATKLKICKNHNSPRIDNRFSYDINVPRNIEIMIIYCLGRSTFGFFDSQVVKLERFFFTIAKVLPHAMLINTLVLFSNDLLSFFSLINICYFRYHYIFLSNNKRKIMRSFKPQYKQHSLSIQRLRAC